MDTDSLKGKVVALSGALGIKRAEAVKIIEKSGGKYVTSITKSCTHIVVADPNERTAKIDAAEQQGVKIVSEDWLMKFQ